MATGEHTAPDLQATGQAPQLVDFSQAATRKAVRAMVFQHPLSVYSGVAGSLVGLAVLLFELPASILLAAIGSIGLCCSSLVVNYFVRADVFAHRYVRELSAGLERHRHRVLANLGQEFAAYHTLAGGQQYAQQGAAQFQLIEKTFESLKNMLGRKLHPEELTYDRYLGTAEQVYLAVLDNLQEIANLLHSVKSIDEDYIAQRLADLSQLPAPDEADRKEVKTLTERQQLLARHLHTVNTLLTLNEEAMTELDKTTATIMAMRTTRGQASIDMETARKELEALAQRSHRYSA